MSRQRGGGGDEDQHEAAASKSALPQGETKPRTSPGTPPGTQTGAKATISRLYQHLTPRLMQTRLPSFSLPTLPSHTRSRIAPNHGDSANVPSANAPSAAKDGFLTAVTSPQSDEEAEAECLAIRREAALTHIQSAARAHLARCTSAPAILARDELVKPSVETMPPSDPGVFLKLKPSGLAEPSEASAGGGGLGEDSCVHTSILRERGGGRPASAEGKGPTRDDDDCKADCISLGDLKTLLASLQSTISQLAAQQVALADAVASTRIAGNVLGTVVRLDRWPAGYTGT